MRAITSYIVSHKIPVRPRPPVGMGHVEVSMNASNLHRPLILFFNSFFDSPPDVSGIKEEYRKKFTWDRDMLQHADAVVFHVPDLVFGTPGIDFFMKLKKGPRQLWVAWSMESAVNYPILKDPRFLSRIDILMTYERSSNIWVSYHPGRNTWLEALRKPLPNKTEIAPLVMFQSASFNRSGRIEFASDLMNKIKTDSYGKLLNNRSLSINDEGRSTKLSTISHYKFCLSLENSIERDYVTEKFFDPLLVGTVPVYRGAPNIEEFAPGEKCFIDANKFSSVEELADYVRFLDTDHDAYREFFAWRKKPLLSGFQKDLDFVHGGNFEKLVRFVSEKMNAPMPDR